MKKILFCKIALILLLVSEESQGQIFGEFTTYTFWTSYNSLVIHPDGRLILRFIAALTFDLSIFGRVNG